MRPGKKLIIGVGNSERGDDEAGVFVARQLRQAGVETAVHRGDALALIDLWSGFESVILIDAVITGAPAGTIHEWNVKSLPPAYTSQTSTHGLGVADAIELARSLGRLPMELRVYGIEGKSFAVGDNISAEVKNAAEQVIQQIQAEATPPEHCHSPSENSPPRPWLETSPMRTRTRNISAIRNKNYVRR